MNEREVVVLEPCDLRLRLLLLLLFLAALGLLHEQLFQLLDVEEESLETRILPLMLQEPSHVTWVLLPDHLAGLTAAPPSDQLGVAQILQRHLLVELDHCV